MAIIEHPDVAAPIVKRPPSLRRNVAPGQCQNDCTNLALVGCPRIALASDQSRRMKREQKMIFIEKVQRYQALAVSLVNRAGSKKTQRLDWNAECRCLRCGGARPVRL